MVDRLGEILTNTLKVIETGKEEIFLIAESTRTETQRLAIELAQLRNDITQTITQVDQQHKVERCARQKLMEVSRDYKRYSEKEMMAAYELAKDSQVQLQLLQAREVQLRSRRDEIERSLRQMLTTIERAENLMTQVNLAINLLQGGITEISQSLNSEQRQEIGLRVIRAQEEERRRVAREIHDGPAQTLANIVLRLEIAEKLLEINSNRAKTELKDLKTLVRSNLQDIRRIIFDLRPMALDDLGIVAAMAKYLENFQATYGIQSELLVEGRAKRLQPTMEVAMFRLIQECMSNVAKHSQSGQTLIAIQFQDDWINTRITDYGQGFNVIEALEKPGEHFGLIGMRERVEMFSGRFSIQSSPGKGTTVEFAFKEEGGTSE
ncbi:MAG: sensor histidine kinase [Desulfitobacteriaceae bacterium]